MYNFVVEHSTQPQQAFFLLGSLTTLGEWEHHRAIQLKQRSGLYWHTSLPIPINRLVEFRYFVAPFDFVQKLGMIMPEMEWVGESKESILIEEKNKGKFQKSDKNNFSIMSFNVLFEVPNEKSPNSW